MLTHYDPVKPLRLEYDASPYGIGDGLSHRVRNIDKSIGFQFRRQSKAEGMYIKLRREALLLVFGVSMFRNYML